MQKIIEIRDPEVDTKALEQRLRLGIEQHKLEGRWPYDLPEFKLPAQPHVPDPTLQYHLEQINDTYDQMGVDLLLAPSAATQVPFIGRIWSHVRRQVHQLILFYLDMAVSRQVGFNEHVAAALNRVVELQQEMQFLREENERLRRRLKLVESRLETLGEGEGR